MSERKQRINIMLHPTTLAELEQHIPEYQRSEYIERLIRKDLEMEAIQQKTGFAVYERSIDDGAGRQTILVNDSKIVSQSIGPKPGLYHSYTGDGNPEWVGQDVSVLRGEGFKRVRNNSTVERMRREWQESEFES